MGDELLFVSIFVDHMYSWKAPEIAKEQSVAIDAGQPLRTSGLKQRRFSVRWIIRFQRLAQKSLGDVERSVGLRKARQPFRPKSASPTDAASVEASIIAQRSDAVRKMFRHRVGSQPWLNGRIFTGTRNCA